jgi:hypothetical protein
MPGGEYIELVSPDVWPLELSESMPNLCPTVGDGVINVPEALRLNRDCGSQVLQTPPTSVV